MSKIKTYDEYKDATLDAVESYNRKDYEKALKQFLDMAEINFQNYKVHEMLVYTYLKLGQTEQAEKEYQIYLDLMKKENLQVTLPRDFDSIVKDAGSLETRKKEFKTVMKKPDPRKMIEASEIPMKLSLLYMAQGDYEQAEQVILEFQQAYSA